MRARCLALETSLLFLLFGCGGGSGNVTTPPSATSFTIGGTVAGLAGSGLVLQDNGGNDLPIPASGPFTFSTTVVNGAAYKVTVHTQPSGPGQRCGINNGIGTVTGNVTDVQVSCTTPSHQWAWMGGGQFVSQPGVYGSKGTAAPTNIPGAREASVTWIDPNGNAWLFGGVGYYAAGKTADYLNDLWNYSNGEWTWISGDQAPDPQGSYGVLGTASSSNAPPAREYALSWADSSGNLWLFGGQGASRNIGYTWLNDLWKFSHGEWTWVAGSNLPNQTSVYGTLGATSASSAPGGRLEAMNWIDSSGSLWLFGGIDVNLLSSGGSSRMQNDLWKFDGSAWTWMGGSNDPTTSQAGIYGTQGAPNPANMPGARVLGATWTDATGNLWLFGGYGLDSVGTTGSLNDLWKYSKGQWTWVGGSNLANQFGSWGTQGVPDPSNLPSSRGDAMVWVDSAGAVWLFGGSGNDTTGNDGPLNDLWMYKNSQWTWVNGSHLAQQAAQYGTLAQPSSTTAPGGCASYAGWVDNSDNLWLFCGYGNDSTGQVGVGYLNDLWKFEP
jgi:N-acetylneuraminic acid mutarotase